MDEILMGLLSPEQQAAAQRQAQEAGLLNLGFGLLQASQGQRGQPRPGLGQVIGQAGPGAVQAYQGSFDQTLRNIMLKQQMDEAQARRAQQQTQQAAVESYISGLPADQQSRFRAFPTQAAESMFREAPEQFQQLTAEETAARGLPANKIFQVSTKTGRVSEVGGGGATVNVGGQQDPFAIEAAKGQAKVFSDIAAAGSTASRNLQNVKRLENTLDRVETGGTAAFKQFAGNFGIKTEGLDDIQAATAIINKLVPEQRAPGSGPMSDADLELFKQSLPRIINTPGGNKKIVEGLKEINNYIVKEAKIANDVLSKKITPEEGRNKLLELGDPVQDFFERNQGASPGSPRVQLPRADEDLINRYLRR
jgi:hypothetical protein